MGEVTVFVKFSLEEGEGKFSAETAFCETPEWDKKDVDGDGGKTVTESEVITPVTLALRVIRNPSRSILRKVTPFFFIKLISKRISLR